MDYEYNGQKLFYHKHLIMLLTQLSAMMKANGIRFWLDFGTLLGAVRNGKIIPWDYDIDISISNYDTLRLLKVFSEAGINQNYNSEKTDLSIMVDSNSEYARIIRSFYSSNTKVFNEEQKVLLKNNEGAKQWGEYYSYFPVHVDIYPWVWAEDGDSAFVTVKPNYSLPKSCFQDMGKIEFEGSMYPCWIPPEPFLVKAYGEDWRKPKIQSGNRIWADKYAPGNTDIIAEMKKYKGC